MSGDFKNLTFCFDDMSFCGIPLGKKIGNRGDGVERNRNDGYEIEIIDNRIGRVSFFFHGQHYGFSAFQGTLEKDQENLQLCDKTSKEDVIAIFGLPSDEWSDYIEENLSFHYKEYLLEFSWSIEHEPKTLVYLAIDQTTCDQKT